MSKFLIPLIFALGSVFIAMLYIVPSWQHYLAIRANDAHLQEISAEIDTLTTKRDQLIDKINAISKDDFQRIGQMLPQGAQAPEFLLAIQQIAALHHITLKGLTLTQSISTEPKTPTSAPESGFVPTDSGEAQKSSKDLSVNTQLTSSYETFKDFLRDIEVFARITDVKTLAFTADSQTSNFTFTLTLATHYQ